MNYPRYRREGRPITSSLVGPPVGEFNGRVKGPQKSWGRADESGAESIPQVRAAVWSEDGRLSRHFTERPGSPYRRRKAGQEIAKAFLTCSQPVDAGNSLGVAA